MESEPKNSADQLLKLAIFTLLLAVVLVAGWKLSPLLRPQAEIQAALDPNCDIHNGPCAATFPDGARLSFSVEPRNIPILQPLTLKVEVQGLEASQVEVDFSGVEMNMGYNRPTLEPQGGGIFQGQGTLPVCVRNRMLWEAQVLARTAAGSYAAPFRFWTVHGSSPN